MRTDVPADFPLIRSIAVFCGSSAGADPKWAAAASTLGTLLAQRKVRVIYGGGSAGLMGTLAEAALSAGGAVVGISTDALTAIEPTHPALTELHIVADMGARKQMMVERADAFVMLPGGLGTMDEWFEVLTLKALRLTDQPCAVLNIDGYYDPLRVFLEHASAHQFIKRKQLQAITWVQSAHALINAWTL